VPVYLDFDAIRKEVEERMGPGWTARYGEEAWRASMVTHRRDSGPRVSLFAPATSRALESVNMADFVKNGDEYLIDGVKVTSAERSGCASGSCRVRVQPVRG
jgi:hypothetical protein